MSATTATTTTVQTPVPEQAPVPVVAENNEEKQQQQPQVSLAPAPLPTSSPWKAVTTDIPVTSISIDELEATRRKNKTPTPIIKSTNSTKWVPMKASITVSANGTANNNRRNGKKSSNIHSADSSKSVKSNNSINSRKKKHHHNTNSTKKQTKQDTSEQPEDATEDQSQEDKPQDAKASNNKANGSQRRKFHNNSNAQQQHPKSNNHNGFTQRNNNNNSNNRKYHRHHNNHNHAHAHPQQMAQLQTSFYPVQPVMMAINSIARQLEYYLSNDNLINDTYLRSKFSKDGYVPLNLLAQFYRIVNMSFGGDSNIILAALREIVINDAATIDIAKGKLNKGGQEENNLDPQDTPLDSFFVRCKDWEKWLPETISTEVEIETVLVGDNMDEYQVNVINLPADASSEAPVSSEATESVETPAPAQEQEKEENEITQEDVATSA